VRNRYNMPKDATNISPATWITHCYLPPDTGEQAPPNPSHKGLVLV